MGELGASLRYFSGEDCEYRKYRRWKLWASEQNEGNGQASEEARGSSVWTLMQGQALEAVEHLKASEYQVKGLTGQEVAGKRPSRPTWRECLRGLFPESS